MTRLRFKDLSTPYPKNRTPQITGLACIKCSGRGGGLNMCYVICLGGLVFVLQNVMEGGEGVKKL